MIAIKWPINPQSTVVPDFPFFGLRVAAPDPVAVGCVLLAFPLLFESLNAANPIISEPPTVSHFVWYFDHRLGQRPETDRVVHRLQCIDQHGPGTSPN
jgi:hypothetical protein